MAKHDTLGVFAVITATTVILFLVSGMARVDLWLPLHFQGDSVTAYFYALNAAYFGDSHKSLNVGFPFPAELYLFPQRDRFSAVVQYIIGIYDKNPFFVLNVFTVLSFYVSAISFYSCARVICISPLASAAVSVCFAFNAYTGVAVSHSVLMPIAAVPMGVLIAVLIASKDTWTAGSLITVVAFSTVIGIGVPYWAFFSCVLIAGAGALAALGNRSWKPLAVTGLSVGALAAGFSISWGNVIYQTAAAGYVSRVGAKTPDQQAILGLNYLDLFIPKTSAFAPFRALSSMVAPSRNSAISSIDLYIGFAGVLGLLALAVVLAQWFSRRPITPTGRLDTYRRSLAGLLVICLLFAASGGFGYIFGVFVTPVFRASFRMAVVVSSIALFGLAISFEMLFAKAASNLAKGAVVWALIAVCGFSAWEQGARTRWDKDQKTAVSLGNYTGHRDVCTQAAERLPAGSAVLELPLLAYVDGGERVHNFHTYMHLACPVFEPGLNWSFGQIGNSAQAAFVQDASRLAPRELVASALAMGFRAILIDRRAYPDNAAGLTDAILKYGSSLADDGTLFLVDLKGGTLPSSGEPFAPVVADWTARGFAPIENDGNSSWRWSDAPTSKAAVYVCNYRRDPAAVVIAGTVESANGGSKALVQSDFFQWEAPLNANRAQFDGTVAVPQGCHIVSFSVDAKPIHARAEDNRSLGLRLIDFQFTDTEFDRRVSAAEATLR